MKQPKRTADSTNQTKLTVEALSKTETHIEAETGTAQILVNHKELVMAAGDQLTATVGNTPVVLTATVTITPTLTIANTPTPSNTRMPATQANDQNG